MLQNATPLRKSAPGPPNISDEHVSCTAPATENASLQILFKCPMPASVFETATKPSLFAHFWQGAKFPGACHANHILSLKSAPRMVCFVHFDWECASCHNGVHFLNISTSKSAPTLVCFVHFDFEMCFAPQRRALFRRVNVQKCCGVVVFLHFDLEMCFAPQRRAIFHLSSRHMAPHPPL